MATGTDMTIKQEITMKFVENEEVLTFLQLIVFGLKNLGITADAIADNPEGALNEIPLDDNEDHHLDISGVKIEFDWGYEYVRFFEAGDEEAFLILGVCDESGKNEFVVEGVNYDNFSN